MSSIRRISAGKTIWPFAETVVLMRIVLGCNLKKHRGFRLLIVPTVPCARPQIPERHLRPQSFVLDTAAVQNIHRRPSTRAAPARIWTIP